MKQRSLLVEFFYRAWPGWFVLLGSGVWYVTTGGPKTTAPCIQTAYFKQIWNTVAILMAVGGLYDLWSMARAVGTPDYQDKRPWAFITLAWLLSIWTIFLCGGG